jgi:hypothetical protein
MQIVNRDELMSAMHDIGRTFGLTVRPYTATPRAPFESILSVMARTGVLVARHGPFLANAIFLPPGDKTQFVDQASNIIYMHNLHQQDSLRPLSEHVDFCVISCSTHELLMAAAGETKTCVTSGMTEWGTSAGASLIELLPYNWEWKGLSKLYKNITSSTKDPLCFAWQIERACHTLLQVQW